MLKIGVAIKEITPNERILLSGYPEPKERYAISAHDPLYCSAYYFDNGKERLLFLCNDVVSMQRSRCDELRMLVEKHCGIPRQNVAVSCTHTHSGPVTGGNTWERLDDVKESFPENNDRMRDLQLAAAKEAVANAFDAKIGFGIGTCGKEQGVGGNRHDPDGACDPSVTVIGIKDQRDVLRGCIVNYSMHPTVLHSYNFRLTADFPCYIRDTLSEKYPEMVFGFNMGSSGNQSTRFFRSGQNFDEAKRIGSAIGREADRVLSEMQYTDDIVLKAASTFVKPPLKKIPSVQEAQETAKRARAEYDKLVEDKAPYAICRTAECTLIGSDFMLGMSQSVERAGSLEKILMEELPLEAMAIRLGDCVIMGVSCENFIEISQAIKRDSPFRYTMMSSLTNGQTNGYVCADYAYDEFCYEAQCSAYAKGCEKALVEACMEAIEKVR